MKNNEKILFIADNSLWSKQAEVFLKNLYGSVTSVLWEPSLPFPESVDIWKGDWIYSFKSDLILSEKILGMASKGNINFHPAPPKYRGLGGYTYALSNKDDSFGVTCHHIDEKIDHGEIIAVINFDIFPWESSANLKDRTAVHCLGLFFDIVSLIANGNTLPESHHKWGNKLHTSKELDVYLKALDPAQKAIPQSIGNFKS